MLNATVSIQPARRLVQAARFPLASRPESDAELYMTLNVADCIRPMTIFNRAFKSAFRQNDVNTTQDHKPDSVT